MLEAWHVLTTCGTVALQFQSNHLSPVDLRRPACLAFYRFGFMHATHWVIDSINRTLTEFSEIWESQLFCSNCFSRRFISSCLSSQSLENDVMEGWLQFPALLDGTCASSSCAWCLSTLKGDLISCAKESFSRNFGDPCRKGQINLKEMGLKKNHPCMKITELELSVETPRKKGGNKS